MIPSLILCPRLQQLDEENSELRSCTPCLKANIERLEEVSCQPGAQSRQGQALHCVDTEVSWASLWAFPHLLCLMPTGGSGYAEIGSLKQGSRKVCSQPRGTLQARELRFFKEQVGPYWACV